MTWRSEAACAGMDTALFHTDDPRLVREAKNVCRSCPMREACLDHAIEARERDGVWGGMDADERRKEARRRGRRDRGEVLPRHVVCEWCSEPFTTTHPRAIYCGRACVRAADAQRQRLARLERTA